MGSARGSKGLSRAAPRAAANFRGGSGAIATLVAKGVSKHHGTEVVLDRVDLSLGPQSRLGIVGPNGIGKSTLLRILAGLDDPDSGTVTTVPRSATVGYLAQERDALLGETLRAYLTRRTGVAEAQSVLDRAATNLAETSTGPGRSSSRGGRSVEDDYAAALERYLALGGPDLDARIAEVGAELGIEQRLLDMEVAQLSGGQASRAALAALALARFDIVLLDEPTNDLDFDGLEQLEELVRARPGGLAIVAHDRAFLERVVTSVAELSEPDHRLVVFEGGWNAYLDMRETQGRHAGEAYGAYVSERARLQSRERRQRQWADQGVARAARSPKDNDKAQRGFKVNRTEHQASKVRQTERALERLAAVDKPFESWELHLDLAAAPRSGKVVARLHGATVRRGEFVLGPIDFELDWGERVGILGPNGSGKTTLIGAIVGTFALASGERWLGPGVVIGQIGQERRGIADHESLIAAFSRRTGSPTSRARSLLAKFGLGARDVERGFSSLSPGERTRAELALLMALGTNCLVLDEPTNHLDLPAIEQLEAALSNWEGTLLLVTHDRRLLDSVALSRTITLRPGGGALAIP